MKLLELMKRLDTQRTGDGRVRVLALQHAQAEDLANTLNQMLQGSGAAARATRAPGGGTAAGMFEGDVRVTADKATNSLVITSTGHDYAAMRLVIDRLDMPRRQVFIEAVIMDLSSTTRPTLGMSFHGGTTVGADNTLLLGGFNAAIRSRFRRPEPASGRGGRRAWPGARRSRELSAPASASRHSVSCSMRIATSSDATCSPRRTSSPPTT